MQISINIKNDSVAHKVIWFLNHLKEDGVEILNIDTQKPTKSKAEPDLKNLQESVMLKTWDNDEDKAWDAL